MKVRYFCLGILPLWTKEVLSNGQWGFSWLKCFDNCSWSTVCETPETCNCSRPCRWKHEGWVLLMSGMPLKSLHERLAAWVSRAEEIALGWSVVVVVQTCCDLPVACRELLGVTSRGLCLCHSQPCMHHHGRKPCPWADSDFSMSCNWYFLRFPTVIPLIHQYLFQPQMTRFFVKEVERLYSHYKEGEA